jgi:hypothetical protein
VTQTRKVLRKKVLSRSAIALKYFLMAQFGLEAVTWAVFEGLGSASDKAHGAEPGCPPESKDEENPRSLFL